MPFFINDIQFQEDCGREAGRSPTFRYATESASEAQRSLQKIGFAEALQQTRDGRKYYALSRRGRLLAETLNKEVKK